MRAVVRRNQLSVLSDGDVLEIRERKWETTVFFVWCELLLSVGSDAILKLGTGERQPFYARFALESRDAEWLLLLSAQRATSHGSS